MGYGLTGKMLVNLVGGCVQAKTVTPGSAMWTLDGDRAVRTTVVDVTAVKARAAVDVTLRRPKGPHSFASRTAGPAPGGVSGGG